MPVQQAFDLDALGIRKNPGTEIVASYDFESFDDANNCLLKLQEFLSNQNSAATNVVVHVSVSFRTSHDLGALLTRRPTGENPLTLEWDEVEIAR